jgi:tetratricopeptide (TPR) repeat protein
MPPEPIGIAMGVMRPLKFTYHRPSGDRRHFITEADVRVVLDRLPAPLWKRLNVVHFNDRGLGRRWLGYVTRKRDQIALCALPPRVSLAACLRGRQSPSHFGAVRGCQWPALAVRRLMLYHVFLHELGHIQIVDENARTTRRKFRSETRAEEFADAWCRTLWAQPFEHPDPVHNPPTSEEIARVRDGWQASHRDYKNGLLCEKSRRYEGAVSLLSRAVERYPGHELALERLGVLTFGGTGTDQSYVKSIELLSRAVRLDPALFEANLVLAMALAREGREAEARRGFETAMLLDSTPPFAMTRYADATADWGYFAEAEELFLKAIKRNPRCVVAIRDYGRSLLRDDNSDAQIHLGRAIALFERAVALDPEDAESHYRLGDASFCVDGDEERAIAHLRKACRINPTHAKAAARLAEAEAWLKGDLLPRYIDPVVSSLSVAQCQRDHDRQPEQRGGEDDGHHAVAVLQVHEKERDQRGLGDRDAHGNGKMQRAEGHVGRGDGRQQEREQHTEDHEIEPDRGNVVRHGWTSIR